MKLGKQLTLIGAAAIGVTTASTFADFAGQTILGPLTDGSVVNGTLIGASDDNDGFTSGDHIFNIWDGGDVVYQLDWTGGSMLITLESLGGTDADLFLYLPGSLNDSGNYSIRGGFDSVQLNGAAAGTYYIVVDTVFFGEGDFILSVSQVPAPGALALLGVAGLVSKRRRRLA